MIVFILQSLFLIAAAFIAGAILGNIFKRFSRKSESVSEHSTRAADARLASIASLGIAANDDISKSAREAAAMVPPAEPVPAINPVPAKSPRKAVKKSVAKSAARERNPRQDEKNRPPVLRAARRGKPDQLIAIDGIGNTIQSKLFELGVFHYDQIAAWTVEQAAWVSEEIGFPGRAHRESWIRQAAALVKPATKAVKPKPAPRKTAAKPAGTRKSG